MTERVRAVLTWMGLVLVVLVPIVAASFSPLLAWREPIYIAAGFAGIIGLILLIFQPLLVAGKIPGLTGRVGRRVHQWVGATLVAIIATHVAALWVTSPPDVVDALLIVSPTPFSVWGVLAMWAIFGAALMVLLRRKLRLPWTTWRLGHVTLAVITVGGTIAHALLIEGTMETISKAILCALVALAAVVGIRSTRQATRRS